MAPYAIYAGAAASVVRGNGPLDLQIAGTRVLRLEAPALPNITGAPNLIAGSPAHYAASNIVGATIGGGGALDWFGDSFTNRVTADFGTIAGGRGNMVSGIVGVVGGVRAIGGVRFVSSTDVAGTPTAGVSLTPGSGTWSSLSDRNAKENFSPTRSREVLDKVAALPIATWNYKSQDKSIRHISPTAQDFHTAFNVGENDRTITTVDADGVALAAIQGLNQKLEAELKTKDAQILQLQSDLAEVKQLLQTLANR